MLDKYLENLSNDAKKLLEHGYFVVKTQNKPFLDLIRNSFSTFLKSEHDIKLNSNNLHNLHKALSDKDINTVRMGFFKHINSSSKNFSFDFLGLAQDALYDVVGTELASNKMVNFSMQLPRDETSLLPIHSDMFSDESPYQINLWVPLTDAHDSNSMFICNPKFSNKVIKSIRDYEQQGLDQLIEEHPKEFTFLEVAYGEALIFSPTCLHGNIVNQTDETRLSFNCRYKNLYSPYTENEESEKKLGSFYQPITPKAASLIGLTFEFDES
jgi:sporadic carbohydrate cluster 2OG-Fe(II) oxygenase